MIDTHTAITNSMIQQMDEQSPSTEVAFDALHQEEVPREASPKKTKKKRDATTLRKAPQAPKRFKSSYICFFMAKQPEIKEELGDKASVTEVSKRSAEMWRNLPADERAHWDDVAAKDKQRYMVEKATYTGPWQVPWKRAKKDPSAPKRPMSAFLYFSQDKRRQIKQENPSIRNTEVSRILGELWRNASVEEKRPHVDKEKEEREKYKIAIAEWRKEFEKKIENQKKQQAEQMNNIYQMNDQNREAAENSSQQPYPFYGDPNVYNPYMHHPNAAYGYQPSQYPPGQMYATNHQYSHPPQGQYGYANGKHVAVLGPNGMPHYPPTTYSHPTMSHGTHVPLPTNSMAQGVYEEQHVAAPSHYGHPSTPPQPGDEHIKTVL